MTIESFSYSHEVENQGPMRVLWVDDREVSPEKVAQFGQAANADVTIATNPQEAVQEWTEGNYNTLILDHQLGNMFGFQVLEAVNKTGKIPSMLAVVTSKPTQRIAMSYGWIDENPEFLFSKDDDYASIGMKVRQTFDEVLWAEGQSPKQLAHLATVTANL